MSYENLPASEHQYFSRIGHMGGETLWDRIRQGYYSNRQNQRSSYGMGSEEEDDETSLRYGRSRYGQDSERFNVSPQVEEILHEAGEKGGHIGGRHLWDEIRAGKFSQRGGGSRYGLGSSSQYGRNSGQFNISPQTEEILREAGHKGGLIGGHKGGTDLWREIREGKFSQRGRSSYGLGSSQYGLNSSQYGLDSSQYGCNGQSTYGQGSGRFNISPQTEQILQQAGHKGGTDLWREIRGGQFSSRR